MRKNVIMNTALVLCLIFIICCVSFTFIPHLHECAGSECSTCALIKDALDALTFFSLAIVISPVLARGLSCILHFDLCLSMRDITPVGRKVKLSD